MRILVACLALGVCPALCPQEPPAAGRWKVQFFYDADQSSLVFDDLQFASARRGVAVGRIEQRNHGEPVSLVTSDGGEHWDRLPLKDEPLSLFFLNEGLGWLATAKGLWQTTEAGRNWTRLPKPPAEILRVYFADEQHGWAVGRKKSVLETKDGGRTWTPVAAAAEPPGRPEFSAYTWIAFATPKDGLICGWNLPPQPGGPDLPAWVDPDTALRRHELPHLTYLLATNDGGKTWRPSSASVFGETPRVRFTPGGMGMSLVVYAQDYRIPSEVYKIDWHTGKSASVYRDPNFSVSDLWLEPDGTVYLAGMVSVARLRDIVPGKVQVLKSRDYSAWTEIPVDYRATARRVTLAASAGEMWMATDTGMILKLVR